jgi:hypothetical protein
LKQYEISLSFAGEERAYVYEVARHLKAANVRVFYDHYERARLWGRDLAEDLQQLYFDESEYVVMFISRHYVAKIWPGHEKRAALAAALTANREYILPVRFDDTPLPGLNPTVRFEDARTTTASELADLILQKLGRNLDLRKGNAVAPPELPSASGTADFDYLSHDGRYIIGTGHYMFETRWTSGPWLYNDPPSISGIATTEAHEITDILDASTADFTSWARSVREGTVYRMPVWCSTMSSNQTIRLTSLRDNERVKTFVKSRVSARGHTGGGHARGGALR